MDYRSTINSNFKGYIKSDRSDYSFSSELQPQIQTSGNIILLVFEGQPIQVESHVITNPDNVVMENQSAGLLMHETDNNTIVWNLECPSGDTSSTDGNYMHFGYDFVAE